MKKLIPKNKIIIAIIVAFALLFGQSKHILAQACPVQADFSAQVSCTNVGEVQFTNLSTTLPGGMIDHYLWDFGDGDTSSAANPIHTYSSTGFFSVSLTAYDTSGCTNEYIESIPVFGPPTASFTFTPDNQCASDPVKFNAGGSTGAGLNYIWDFGDGSVITTTTSDISHVFNAWNNATCDTYQSFVVLLTVTDYNGCTDSVSQVVTPMRKPQPILYDVSGYNFSNCHNEPDPDNPNDTLTVDNQTPNMQCVDSMTIVWGDGAVFTGLQAGDFPITHIYDSLGVYYLVFTAYGTNGCAADVQYIVANQSNPNVGLSALGPNSGCVPFTMMMRLENYHMNSPGTTYTWDFGDGSPPVTWSYMQPFINDTITHIYYDSHCEYGLDYFTVTVSAENECETANLEYPNVRVYVAPEADFEVDSATCVNEPVHFINTSQHGYGGDCDSTTFYTWDFGDGSPLSNAESPTHIYTTPGIYNVTLTACNIKCGCTDTTKQILITGVHADFDFTIPCFGDTGYFFDLSYAYDDSTYAPDTSIQIINWEWDFGDGTTVSGVQNPAHVYATPDTFYVTLTVTSEYGCDSSITKMVYVIFIDIDQVNSTDITCNGYNDGTITVSASGGADTLFYTLMPNNITNKTGFFNNLGPGPYFVWVYDTMCSVRTDTIWINEPDAIEIDSLQVKHITCHDDKDGEIRVFAHGGTGLIFHLYPDSLTSTPTTNITGLFQNLVGGQYYVIVSDSNDCPPDTNGPVLIINPPEMYVDSVLSTNNSCFGNDEGSITVFASGGILPYSFLLIPDSIYNITGVFNNLTNGTYTVDIIDSHNCVISTLPVDITSPPEIVFDTLHTDITCFGDNDGTITIFDVVGGAAPGSYEFSIDDGLTYHPFGLFTNLGPGIYLLKVRDSLKCESFSVPVQIIEPPVLDIVNFNTVPPTCYGCTDGQITANVNGGTPAYSHSWSNGMTGNPITVGAGTYTDTVTDINGCVTFETVILGEPDSLIVQMSAYDVNCHGYSTGWAAATVTGGTPPYSYVWTKAPDTTIIGVTDTIINLRAGLYVVTVLDVFNNFVQDTIEIFEPDSALALIFEYSDTICFEDKNGWAKVIVSGGTPQYTYLWNAGTGVTTDSIYQLIPGSYWVIVTDDLGCIETDTITIIENPYLEINAYTDPAAICQNSSAQLSSVPLGGTPPYSYLWSPAVSLDDPFAQNPVATPDTTTTYMVQIIDARGCPAVDSVKLPVNPSPEADFTYDNPCASNIVYFTDKSLPNGDIIVSWTWHFGDGNSSILQNPEHYYLYQDTTYIVQLIVQNNNGCMDTIVKGVYVNPELGLDIVADTVCNGDSTSFGYTIANPMSLIDSCQWDFGDGNYSTLHNPVHQYALSGLYNVYLAVYDTSGCTEATNKVILVHANPLANFNDSTSCLNNLTYFSDLSSEGGSSLVSWHWNFGDGDTSNQQNPVHNYASEGTYTVSLTVVNANGCENTLIKTILVVFRPVADFIADTACEGELVFFYDQSYTSYGYINYWFWDFGDGGSSIVQNPVHTYTSHGIYTVTLIIANNQGCYDTVTYTLPVYELPVASYTATTVCESMPTQFTDLSIANSDSIQSWFWDFGDGYTSNLQNPIHVFPGTGIYNVTLQIGNSNGCIDDTLMQVVVDSLPSPDFTYDLPTCVNDTCNFYDISLPNADSLIAWHWDFDDGTFSTEQHPYHIYNSSGIFNVVLTITNSNGCVDTMAKALLIYPQPEANYTYDTACVGQTTYFFDQSSTQTGQIIGWYWDFDDPASGVYNTSMLQNPSHMFSSAGIYNVMLIVTNTSYCEDTMLRSVIINEPPTADFNFGSVCVDDTAVFYDLSTIASASISTWIWDFGDGTIVSYYQYQDSITHVFNQSGQYLVTLTVIDSNSCIDDETKLIISNPLPVPLFGYDQICANNQTHFTDYSNGSGTNIIEWFWNFGDPLSGAANYSILQHPTHQFTSAGTFDVTLRVTNANSCSDEYTESVEILPGPVADFTADSVCVGNTTYFNDLSYATNENIISWFWDFGDGYTSSLQFPPHTYTVAGTYFVSLTVVTENNCLDNITKPIEVHHLPVAAFDNMVPNCAGDSTYFIDLSYSIGSNIINSWYWDFGDGSTDSIHQEPVHYYSSAGMYNVTLTVYDTNGCFNTVTNNVLVNPRPVAGFSYIITNCDVVYFTDQSFGINDSIVSWYWDFGDPASGWNNYSILQNPVHVFLGTDTFNVQLIVTDANGCLDTTEQQIILNKPVADFTYDTACVNSGTQFTDLSYCLGTVISQWLWDFDDGTTSVASNPVHNFTAPGYYYVILTVTTQTGCEANIMKPVFVYPLPMADFNADTACLFNPTQFTDMSLPQGAIVSYYWDFGEPASGSNNNSTLANPTHVYLSSGIFNITLIVSDINGCEHFIVKPVYVSPPPDVNFSFADNQCAGVEIYFDDLSSTPTGYITQWIWDYGDGSPNDTIFYPNPPNTSHIYPTGGNFLVTLTVYTSNNCDNSISKSVHIIPQPVADFIWDDACEEIYVQFIDESIGNGGGNLIGWYWDFGDPVSGASNNSYMENPVHLFSSPGTYTIMEIVTNANYCVDTIFKEVVVHPSPGIDFMSGPACHGEQTEFFIDISATNINIITSYLWDFGDGSYSTIQNPSHIYELEGTYDVDLTVVDTNGCENDIMHQVVVRPLPVANFDISGPACLNDSVYFMDLSTTQYGYIEYWIWDFGDGTPTVTIQYPQNPNLYHTYANTGVFGASLTVYSSDSCAHSFIRDVTILPNPVADFENPIPCQGDPVPFTDISNPNGQGAIISWYWEFDDPGSGINNTSTVQNPVHTFNYGDSTYNVLLLVENSDGCFDTIVKPVYVRPLPPVDYGYDIACEDTLINFYPDTSVINMGSIALWEWDFGDGTFAYNPYPAHLYETPGTFIVVLTVTDVSGCMNSIAHDVVVIPLPDPAFTVTSQACLGNPVFFDDNSTTSSGYIVEYYWDFGDGTDTSIYFPNNPDVTHIYSLAGTYQPTLQITTSDSCQNHTSQTIYIDYAPVANFDSEGKCSDEPVNFYDMSLPNGGGNIILWNWDFGDPSSGSNNTSTLQNPSHLFTAAGTYNVILQVDNIDGCYDTIIKTIEVYPPEPVDYTHNGNCHTDTTYFYVDESITDIGAISTFDWDFGDGSTHSSAINPTHIYDLTGYYDVLLTIIDTNGCTNSVMHTVEIVPIPVAVFDYSATCINNVTNFTDLSYVAGGQSIVSWYWDFGDPASGTANYSGLQDPQHTYVEVGAYDVLLVVTTQNNCQDSTIMQVEVQPMPIAAYTYEVNPCENGLVHFYDSSYSQHNDIISWLWTFEPGHLSTEQNPIYIFSQTDTCYEVTLEVTDIMGCKNLINDLVCVPDGLNVEIFYSQACYGEPVYFRDTLIAPQGDTIVSYIWNFGDPVNPGMQSSLPNPSHTYGIPGVFTVSLEVTDKFGCTETIYEQVEVFNLPIADYTYETVPCDSTVHFYDNSHGNGAPVKTWEWIFGDGTSPVVIQSPNSPGVSHQYSSIGTYMASLVVTNENGCMDTITQSVICGPCIMSNFSLLDTLCCQRSRLHFADSSTFGEYINLWEWHFGDGTDTVYTEKAYVITHAFMHPGNYWVKLIVHASINGIQVKDTIVKLVKVMAAPEPNFICHHACMGDYSIFQDSSFTASGYLKSWYWDFGDDWGQSTSTEKNPSYKYHEVGDYVVRLTVKNTYGCVDSVKKIASVKALPVADFTFDKVCKGSPTHFWDLSNPVDGNIVYWYWNFGDTLTILDTAKRRNPYYKYNKLGIHTVELLVTNEFGCKDKIQKDVEVHPIPRSVFRVIQNFQNQQGDIMVEDESIGASGYQWNWGDGDITFGNDRPVLHAYDEGGKYTIQLIVWNEFDCMDTSYHEYQFMFKALYVPNALSPTSQNEQVKIFKPKGIGLKMYICEIFDTWGNILWMSTLLDRDGRPVEGWDGYYKGKLLPQDVYVWRIKAVFRDGSVWEGESMGNTEDLPQEKYGTVTLIR